MLGFNIWSSPEQAKEMEMRPYYTVGEYLHEREMTVFNKRYQGQFGVHIITPLKRPDGYVHLI